MREIRLTVAQQEALRACLGAPPSTGFYRRALALLALDEGQPVAAVAELLGVTRQSIYNWMQAYQHSPKPETLEDHYGGGRPTLWTEQLQALLEEGLRHWPDELGYTGVNWTVPLLRAYLHDQTGSWLCDDTIRRQLDRLGYVWKRFRYVLPPDPEREKKTRDSPAVGGIAAAQRHVG